MSQTTAMSRVSKIKHAEKEIIYVDHRGCDDAQMIDNVKKLENLIATENKPHLQLINLTDMDVSSEFMKISNEFGKKTKHLTTKAAIVGVKETRKILLKMYNLIVGGKLKPFDTEEEAIKYLVS